MPNAIDGLRILEMGLFAPRGVGCRAASILQVVFFAPRLLFSAISSIFRERYAIGMAIAISTCNFRSNRTTRRIRCLNNRPMPSDHPFDFVKATCFPRQLEFARFQFANQGPAVTGRFDRLKTRGGIFRISKPDNHRLTAEQLRRPTGGQLRMSGKAIHQMTRITPSVCF